MLKAWEFQLQQDLYGKCGRIRAYLTANGFVLILMAAVSIFVAVTMKRPEILVMAPAMAIFGFASLFFTSYLLFKGYPKEQAWQLFGKQVVYGIVVTLMLLVFILKIFLVYYILKYFFRLLRR